MGPVSRAVTPAPTRKGTRFSGPSCGPAQRHQEGWGRLGECWLLQFFSSHRALAVSILSQQARTPLEQEIFGLLHRTQQPITDPLLTPEETASLQAMSLEEVSALPPCRALALNASSWRLPSLCAPWQARQRRAELQKARALQSYYEAKARREKRIKSKK